MTFHFISITALLLSFNTWAASCYQVDNKDIVVEWTAFKTPSKVGVGGSFPKVSLTSVNKSDSVKSFIKKAAITINADAISTGNKARDAKISKYFFGNMRKGKKIKASVVSMSSKSLVIKLVLNGKTLNVPMKYTLDANRLEATGYMDVLDASLSKSLAAINKACKALHQGKTWSDVALKLTVSFSKCS
jgi:polyisoprenoid-binding protein YceI